MTLQRGLRRVEPAGVQHPDNSREGFHLLMDERAPLEGPTTHAYHIEIDAPAQTKEGRRQLRQWSDVDDDADVPTVEVGEI